MAEQTPKSAFLVLNQWGGIADSSVSTGICKSDQAARSAIAFLQSPTGADLINETFTVKEVNAEELMEAIHKLT